jgi:hypothetical protein
MELAVEAIQHIECVLIRSPPHLFRFLSGLSEDVACLVFGLKPNAFLTQHALNALLRLRNQAIRFGLRLREDLLALLVNSSRLFYLLGHGCAHEVENVESLTLINHDAIGEGNPAARVDDSFETVYEHQNVDSITSLHSSWQLAPETAR